MIITLFLNFVFILVTFVIGYLPTADALPSYVDTSLQYIFGFINSFDWLFDTTSLYICLFLALTIDAIHLLWVGGHWLLRKIPFLHIS